MGILGNCFTLEKEGISPESKVSDSFPKMYRN